METTVADTSRDCVIFDIDGTIADNTHRLHHILKHPKDWDAFHAGVLDDKPILTMAQLVQVLHRAGIAIVLATCRQDAHRDDTVTWFNNYAIPFTELHMCTTGDFRDQAVVKKELLNHILSLGWRPLFVVEDRKSVVDMWRAAGLVCLQCAEGDF